jgi:hypothetical protein
VSFQMARPVRQLCGEAERFEETNSVLRPSMFMSGGALDVSALKGAELNL